jgi:hypothetical protein
MESADSAWGLVKWLIPSIGGLCILLGYIAKFAHHALLGFDPGLLEPNEYLAASGDFFRWAVHLPFSGVTSWQHALLDGVHMVTLWPALLLGIGVPVWRYRSRTREAADPRRLARASAVTIAALLSVLVLRLVALDAPVARLEGALVASQVWKAGAAPGEKVEQPEDLTKRLQNDLATSTGLRAAIVQRAQTLWHAKRCSRPVPNVASQSSSQAPCTAGHYDGVEEGEGLAQLLVSCLLLILATRVLMDRPPVGRATVAWLAIFSCFLLAATFGKLGQSLEYEFALIGLKSSLIFEEPETTKGAVSGTHATAAAAPAPASTSAGRETSAGLTRFEVHTRQGVLLHSNKAWTTIAIDVTVGCETKVEIWRVANSEILWARDIFRTDILSWSAVKTARATSACPINELYKK